MSFKPNEIYKANPNASEWMAATIACGRKASGMELGKHYFAFYANASADDKYPLIFPYAADKQLIAAVALHAVPKSYWKAVQNAIALWKAGFGKKGVSLAKLAKDMGASAGVFTRRYFPNLLKGFYLIEDIDKAYGLWLSLSGQ